MYDEIIDRMGKFVIMDITVHDYRMTLAAIYGPNGDNPDFFHVFFNHINNFDNSSLIIAGDWNVVQDYNLDTLNYSGQNNPKSQLQIHQMMNDYDLVDIWRKTHAQIRRFSWKGPNKNKVI